MREIDILIFFSVTEGDTVLIFAAQYSPNGAELSTILFLFLQNGGADKKNYFCDRTLYFLKYLINSYGTM